MDLISNLPRDIIESILELLPLQEAVKTSILSKKWRYNWTTISQLCFDHNFLEYIKSNGSLEKIGFENIINSVFHLYRGQALTFILRLPKLLCEDSPDFDNWMLLLSKKGVKKLTLNNDDELPSEERPLVKFPSHLFSCKDLRVVYLNNFVFEPQPPPALICFKNLIALYFLDVEIGNDVLETIVSNASQLQKLMVSLRKGVDRLNVHAPNLREMELYCTLKTINLSIMPDLETATFALRKLDNYSGRKLSVECWPQLKILHLNADSLKVLAAGKATKLLTMKCYHLKFLKLFNINFPTPHQFYYVVSLIKSSPNLQNLEIRCPNYKGRVVELITKSMEEQDWGDCSLDHLRTVKMGWIDCVSPELLLLKGLLRISPVLEEMSFQPTCYVIEDEAVKFNEALEQFPRASPTARVIRDQTLCFQS